MAKSTKANRGLANADQQTRIEVSRKGGKARNRHRNEDEEDEE